MTGHRANHLAFDASLLASHLNARHISDRVSSLLGNSSLVLRNFTSLTHFHCPASALTSVRFMSTCNLTIYTEHMFSLPASPRPPAAANDGATILEQMEVEHQIGKLLVELSRSQAGASTRPLLSST